MSRLSEGVWDERLYCSVLSLTYHFGDHIGHLHMAEHNCCDMQGCVGVFEAIDPSARTIKTYSGDKPDTVYMKDSSGGWQSRLPSPLPRSERL